MGLRLGRLKRPWDQPEPVSSGTVALTLDFCGITGDQECAHFRLLDFGCGNGRYLEAFAGYLPRRNVYGIEVDPQRVLEVHKKGFMCLHLNSQQTSLPFKNESFRVVFSSNVIEHIPRDLYLEYLEEIHRLLEPGGRFVVGTPNYPIKRLYDLRRVIKSRYKLYYLFDDPTHCNKLSVYRLERDLKKLFKLVHLEPSYLLWENKIAWLRQPRIRRLLRIFGYKVSGYCIK